MEVKKWLRNPFVWLVLAGGVLRIGGAVLFSCNYSGDHAIPCMMSKHIIEGHPAPVFYYGQPYMGSLEPILGALLYRLPFSPNFTCNLATAIFGILLLPLVAWWGCRVGGRRTGLTALAVMVIGPPVYAQFMNWAYGGYAAATFFVTATALCGVRLIERERQGSAPLWLWLLCGISGGLGWWTSPLILIALGALFLMGVWVLRARCLQWKLIPALLAFFLFGLPFWIWDVAHQWAAVRFILADSANDLPGGMKRFVHGFSFALLNTDTAAAVLGSLLVFLLILFLSVRTWRTRPGESRGWYLAVAWLMLLSGLLLFLRKPMRIGPSRYFLPLLPALGVLFAYGVTELTRGRRSVWVWVAVLPVIALQASFLPTPLRWFADRHAYYAELESLRPYFEALDTEVIFTDYAGERKYGHGLNLYFQEAWCFTDVPEYERCPYYVLKGEQAEAVASLNNKNALLSTMRSAGYSARTITLPNGLPLTDRFEPPPGEARPLTDGFVIHEAASGLDLTDALSDGNRRTFWRNRRQMPNQVLEVRFDAPQKVRKFRLVGESAEWPEGITVWAQDAGSDAWEQVGARHMMTGWYWPDNAPRPYSAGGYYRQEIFLDRSNVAALRIMLNDNQPHTSLEISELQLFTDAEAGSTAPEEVEVLIQTLRGQNVKRIYCDRWTANLLNNRREEDNADWRISMDPHIVGEQAPGLPVRIDLSEAWSMVVRPENAVLCRRLLGEVGLTFREQPVGRRVLFLVEPGDPSMPPLLTWRGFGPQLNLSDADAEALCRSADTALRQGDVQKAEQLTQQLLHAWPDYLPALHVQLALLKREGRGEEAAELERRLALLEPPAGFSPVRFSNGVELRGVLLPAEKVQAGTDCTLRYDWQIPDKLILHGCAVFCHVVNQQGDIALSDDRVLLDDYRHVTHPFSGYYVETRALHIPETLPPGAYSVQVGLYQSNPPHRRMRAKSALPVVKRAVLLPGVLEVTAAE